MHDHSHHDHSHAHHHHHGGGNLRAAFFLNLIFTLLEIVGGFWTGSAAILADALHDLGDSFSLGLAWFLDNYSKKGSNRRFSYGYARFSLLGALINGLIIMGGSIAILVEVIPRLWNPTMPKAEGMLVFAILGVIVNGAAVLKLKSGTSMNERVARLHLLEDVLGWIAVLISSIILMIWEIPLLDPILSLIITAYILSKTFGNLRKTMLLFLQAVPEEENLDEMKEKIGRISNVKSLHHLHLWSLDGEKHVLSAHLVVDREVKQERVFEIKKEVREILDIPGLRHITLEVEFEGEECGMEN
ncbi:MAG: cation transporter [Bacteroidia bacterium]|nr:cation transporter [Bacteroidia bacterium]